MSEEIKMHLQPLLEEEEEEQAGVVPVKPQLPRRRRRGRITALVIVLLVILIASGVIFYMRRANQPVVRFTQAAVTTGNITVQVSATGPVTPNAEYDMNFLTAGQVKAIDVEVGQQVKKGQVLAKLNIDKTALESAVNQAQLGVVAAQNSAGSAQANLGNVEAANEIALKIAKAQEQNALAACENAESTPTSSATPAPTVSPNCDQLAKDQYAQAQQQANTSATSAQNQIVSSQNSLNNALAQLQSAQNNLTDAAQNATLTAPVAATVAAINGSIGETVGTGSSSTSSQAFIVLLDMSKIGITAQVNEADIGGLQVGQPAQFTVTAYPTQTFRASVTAVETIGQATSNVVYYTVKLTVNKPSLNGTHLYSGMTATVNITTAERIGVLLVPATALSFPGIALQSGELSRSALSSLASSATSTATGTRGVVVVLRNGKLVPVAITTGLSNGQFTEVLSGLREGDQVVVSQTGGTTTTPSNGGGGGGGGGNPFRGGFGG
jgi:multidrug efflux pump subunit AcrA (membrane-fusion protein)